MHKTNVNQSIYEIRDIEKGRISTMPSKVFHMNLPVHFLSPSFALYIYVQPDNQNKIRIKTTDDENEKVCELPGSLIR